VTTSSCEAFRVGSEGSGGCGAHGGQAVVGLPVEGTGRGCGGSPVQGGAEGAVACDAAGALDWGGQPVRCSPQPASRQVPPEVVSKSVKSTLDQLDTAGTIETMTAYVISDVVGRDPELVARYRDLARASIERYGGRYLTDVGAQIDHVEGDWTPRNLVIVAFPSLARARRWYASEEYAQALDVRARALDRNLIIVVGADEQ
jgi:uncharacterized protein (DUF1330 family)